MSILSRFPAVLAAALAVGMATVPTARAQSGIIVNDVDVTGLTHDPVTGLLTASTGTVTGTLASLPFTTDLQNFTLELVPGGPACSVLDLTLGPIDLDLLGLSVDTTPICLEITALPGQGLLGDLLCGLAGGNFLLLPDVLNALPGLLTNALAQTAQGAGPDDICDGTCTVLDLSLGPVNVTLLGLNVFLHDCRNGPVQVCVSATAGQGLLGDLLCGLAGGPFLLNLQNLISLLNAIAGLDGLGTINATPAQLQNLLRILERSINNDGMLSGRELNALVRAIVNLLP